MTDSIDGLKSLWHDARRTSPTSFTDADRIVKTAVKQKRDTLKMHVLTILVLTITLVGISAYFIYVANFKQLVSHIGVALMTGSLCLRIIIELYSIFLSTRIDLSASALNANSDWLNFYQFRKKIHGPVTITLIALYTIGFYLLTPEFSRYFNLAVLILIDLSYVVGAVIYTWFIRRAIRKEMRYLDVIVDLQQKLSEDGNQS